MHGTKPITKTVQLTNRVAKIVVFDFMQQCVSLLSDKILMQDENLVLGDDPTAKPPCPGGELGELNTGSCYRRAYKNLVKHEDDFLCPLAFFIDKTFVDLQSRNNSEPVVFTFTIFNRKTRRQHRAWRPLGFVADLNLQSSAQGR